MKQPQCHSQEAFPLFYLATYSLQNNILTAVYQGVRMSVPTFDWRYVFINLYTSMVEVTLW